MKRIVCPPLAAPQGIIAHWHIQEGASLGGDGTGLPMVDIRLQRGAITTLTMFGDSAGCVLKAHWVHEGACIRPGETLALIGKRRERIPRVEQVERLETMPSSPDILSCIMRRSLVPATMMVPLVFLFSAFLRALEPLRESNTQLPPLLDTLFNSVPPVLMAINTLLLAVLWGWYLIHKRQTKKNR